MPAAGCFGAEFRDDTFASTVCGQSCSSSANASSTFCSYTSNTVRTTETSLPCCSTTVQCRNNGLHMSCRSAGNPDAEVSVQLEESLMQALRQIEATIDSVVTVLSNSIPGFVTASSTPSPQVDIDCLSSSNAVLTEFLHSIICLC